MALHWWCRSIIQAQTVAEYALLMATIAVLALMGSRAFGELVHGWFTILVRGVTSSGT